MKNKLRFFKIIIAAAVFISFFSSVFFIRSSFASDTSLLSNLNNPNVLIFLDTSGSMMWNEGVAWSGAGGSGYDNPESWAAAGNSSIWAPESDSVFSKIYNAKLAIAQIVADPSFSNLNFAFATFDQPSPSTNYCVYSSDASFTNPSNAPYYPTANGSAGVPDETGNYYVNNNYNDGVNPNYPFMGDNYIGSYCTSNANLSTQVQNQAGTCSLNGTTCYSNYDCTQNNCTRSQSQTGTCSNNSHTSCTSNSDCGYRHTCNFTYTYSCSLSGTCSAGEQYCTQNSCTFTYNTTTTGYFVSYGYPSNSNNGPWTLYIPDTTNGSLSTTASTTVSSNPNNSADPYFDPASIAGPAVNYVLWTAQDYGSGATDPAGNAIIGLKADGDTPMYEASENMISYFTNSLSADSSSTCRRNFNVIITDGEANDPQSDINNNVSYAAATPYELYRLYANVDGTFPIETFVVGFGYDGTPGYIQQMANAGAGLTTTESSSVVTNGWNQTTVYTATNSPIEFTPTDVISTTAVTAPPSDISNSPSGVSTNVVLVGDTVSDNGWQSSDCEENNNNSGTYAPGFDCALVTAVYPNTDEILLSNSIKNINGPLYVSGTVYLANNLAQLASSLSSIFGQIESQSTSFTTPVIHEVYGQNSDVYYADFKSLNQPLWGEGNIFLFKLNGSEQLIGPNGVAVDALGNIITSDSYWDGGAGAGGLLQTKSPASRYVITSNINAANGSISTIPFDTSNDSNLESYLGLTATNYSAVCPGSSSESTCADDIINFVLNPDGATDSWKLGAILHSQPVLISSPPYPYSSQSYQEFKTQPAQSQRPQVLVVGANDGMLHGFDAGTWNNTTNSYSDGTGAELFGYIPPDFLDTLASGTAPTSSTPGFSACIPSQSFLYLPKLTCWYESSVSTPSIYQFVDSTPSISDVFFGNVFNGTVNGAAASSYPVSTGTPVSSWHTVLIGGEQDGGTSYYALDLTNPANIGNTYPSPLWDFSDNASGTTDPMGDTWSQPLISFVCLPSNPYYSSSNGGTGICGNNPNPTSPLAAPQYVETYAAFIGGGYSSNNSAGQAVYALYAEPNPVNTGTSSNPVYVDEQELWKFDSANDSNMKYSIPSAVSPVTTGDFMLQAFYVGDLGGQMWAFYIPFGESPLQGGGKNSNWTGCRIFASNQTSSPLNIFFQPAISYDSAGNLWLYFGTGDRENLSAVNATRDNEFIGINTAGTDGVGECASKGPYSETNLTDETGTSGIGSAPSSTDGWYITLSSGEKMVGAPLIYDDIVYFDTYTPSSASAACGYGAAKLYAVYFLNGGGTIITSDGKAAISNTATGSSGGAQSMSIGTGVPSPPVISNGNLIITTSSGIALTQKIPSMASKLLPTSWFQLP